MKGSWVVSHTLPSFFSSSFHFLHIPLFSTAGRHVCNITSRSNHVCYITVKSDNRTSTEQPKPIALHSQQRDTFQGSSNILTPCQDISTYTRSSGWHLTDGPFQMVQMVQRRRRILGIQKIHCNQLRLFWKIVVEFLDTFVGRRTDPFGANKKKNLLLGSLNTILRVFILSSLSLELKYLLHCGDVFLRLHWQKG